MFWVSASNSMTHRKITAAFPPFFPISFINKIMPTAQTQVGGDNTYEYHPLPGPLGVQTTTEPEFSTVNNSSDIHSHMRTDSD